MDKKDYTHDNAKGKRRPGLVRPLLYAGLLSLGLCSSAYGQQRIDFPGGYLREEPRIVQRDIQTKHSSLDSLEFKVKDSLSIDAVGQSYVILDKEFDGFLVKTYREAISRVSVPRFLERTVERFVDRTISIPTLSNSSKFRDLYDIACDSTQEIVKPKELQATVIVESGGNIRARSPSDALGLMQFVYGTGKRYVGPINGSLDFRLDPLSAIEGGAKYLRDLTELFGSKILAVAAYNCGEGLVMDIVKRLGKKYAKQGKSPGGAYDMENIFWHLPKETRGYVVSWLANLIALDRFDYKLLPKHFEIYDRITTTKGDTLIEIAKARGIPPRELAIANLHIKNANKSLDGGIEINIPK